MKRKDINFQFYNQVWRYGSIQNPRHRFTWELVKSFEGQPCLEIGPGNSPIIPLKKGIFLEASQTAVDNLKSAGLNAFLGQAEKIPFKNNHFRLVVAWHVLEHIKNDKKTLLEIYRVLKNKGFFLLAVPLGPEKFSKIDKIVGHQRRYQPEKLIKILEKNDFRIAKHRAGRGLMTSLFRQPIFLPLATKILKYSQSPYFSGIPESINNFVTRLTIFMEKMAFRDWEEGEPQELKKADNLVLFCQKSL
jgi:ubiquinone/menaquinone biosynthesis C-methylase UbiE